jgi:hypothetical protein
MLVHPTPVHIRTCVTDAICEEMTKRGEYVPTWVWQAVKDGIARACAEHDRDINARAAA